MLQLYFIRHGETEWNRQQRLQGRLDSPLTEQGIKAARRLADRLAAVDFTAVISSSSKRAVETAEILLRNRKYPLMLDDRLMEIDLGEWQGKTQAEIREFDPHGYQCYYEHPHLYSPNCGENFLDVKERVEEFLHDVEKRFSSGKLLIVTHGMVIKALQQLICKGLPVERLWDPPWIEGTSVTIVLAGRGRRELIVEGDITHLQNEAEKDE